MTDDLEKACKKWLETWDYKQPAYKSLAAFVREQVKGEYERGANDRSQGAEDALNDHMTECARNQVAQAQRIAALEAQQEADHAWIDADAKTKEAQQNEINELEAEIRLLQAALFSAQKNALDQCGKLEVALEKADEMAISAGMVRDNEESWYNSRIEANLNAYQRARAKTKVAP